MVRAAIEIVRTGSVLMDGKTMRCSDGGQGNATGVMHQDTKNLSIEGSLSRLLHE